MSVGDVTAEGEANIAGRDISQLIEINLTLNDKSDLTTRKLSIDASPKMLSLLGDILKSASAEIDTQSQIGG